MKIHEFSKQGPQASASQKQLCTGHLPRKIQLFLKVLGLPVQLEVHLQVEKRYLPAVQDDFSY